MHGAENKVQMHGAACLPTSAIQNELGQTGTLKQGAEPTASGSANAFDAKQSGRVGFNQGPSAGVLWTSRHVGARARAAAISRQHWAATRPHSACRVRAALKGWLVGWLLGSWPAHVSEARPALPPWPKLGVQAGRKLDAAKTQEGHKKATEGDGAETGSKVSKVRPHAGPQKVAQGPRQAKATEGRSKKRKQRKAKYGHTGAEEGHAGAKTKVPQGSSSQRQKQSKQDPQGATATQGPRQEAKRAK